MKKNNLLKIFILCFIDQIIKIFITNNLIIYKDYNIINNFFSIIYVKNTGAAFSILENNNIFFIIISIIILIILFKNINNNKNKIYNISYILIISGILANLLDRIRVNAVIDYLSFKIFNNNFPIFNIADIYIVLGVLITIIIIIKDGKNDCK